MERRTFIGRLLLAPLAVLGFLNMKSAVQPNCELPRGMVTVSGGELTPESKERLKEWKATKVEYGQPYLVVKNKAP